MTGYGTTQNWRRATSALVAKLLLPTLLPSYNTSFDIVV